MHYFSNNFLCVKKPFKQFSYVEISQKMTDLHSSCFNHFNRGFQKKNMLSFLKDSKDHIFFNEISLAIVKISGLEADLITLMVDPTKRRTGVASNLLQLIILYLKDLKVEELFLEVATCNKAALRLYNKLEFKPCGVRKNYYLESGISQRDASVMVCNLSRKNGNLDKKKLQKL